MYRGFNFIVLHVSGMCLQQSAVVLNSLILIADLMIKYPRSTSLYQRLVTVYSLGGVGEAVGRPCFIFGF